MGYLSSKKIYPGNWCESLNGWYKNTSTTGSLPLDASVAGPTSVLATPGYRYFQTRGYVQVNVASGNPITEAQVIVPSPYRNDPTRVDITGMYVSGDTANPVYPYRATISVASGWNDGRVSSGVYAATGNVISFGRDNSGSPTAASGVGEGLIQANLTSTVSGDASGKIFFPEATSALSNNPFVTATGAAGNDAGNVFLEITGQQEFKVYAKGGADETSVSGGFYISDQDLAAQLFGYIVVELCYIQPDFAADYNDIEAYLPNRTVPSGQY